MKSNLVLTIVTVFTLTFSYAQTKKNTFFEQKSLINKFHTIGELENLKKGELIKLYTKRAREIITVIPYLALSNEPGVSLSDIGIKENSGNLKTLDKHHQSTIASFENTSDMISEFIPYADTEKIVAAILYFEDVIKKTRIGLNNSF